MVNEPQKLYEFTKNLLVDLENNIITPQEAISACQQYAYLRELLTEKNIELSSADTLGDEELKSVLHGLILETSETVKELPSFQGVEPDAPREEQEIRDSAAIRKAALLRSHEATKAKLAPLQAKRREFIRSLVSKYSETETESRLKKSFIEAAKERNMQQSKERFVSSFASTLPENDRARVFSAIEANQDYFTATVNAEVSELERAEAVYTHLDIKRADVLVDVLLNAPEDQKNEALIRGMKLAQVAQTLENNKQKKAVVGGFFSNTNAKGVTKGLQQASEGILSLVGEPLREIIYKEKVNGTLRELLTNTQTLTDRLGEAFVHSSLFSHITQDLTKSLNERTTGMSQAHSVFGDVFGSIFKSPTDEATRQQMLDYFELSRANANAPKGHAFMAPNLMPWEIFGRQPQPTTQTPRFRLFPYLSLGSLGRKAGDMFSSGVDRTTSFLFNNPRVRNQLQSSRRAALVPTPFLEDLPLLIATVVVIVLVYMYIFPSPFNTASVGYSSKVSALLASLYKKLSSGEIICTGDCRWPTSGKIAQGPSTNSTHQGTIAQSIDITGNCGTPVISTLDGSITAVYDECTDNTGAPGNKCGGGWGNYIIINGKINNGTISLRYGHLVQGSMPEVETSVSIGQQIGLMDHNGNSSACHLHYEVVGNQPDINTILPYEVPACVSSTDCCEQLEQLGNSCEVSI